MCCLKWDLPLKIRELHGAGGLGEIDFGGVLANENIKFIVDIP